MQEVDLIISCFNPSVASIAKSNMEYLKSKYFGYTEFEKLLKLIDEKFDLISQGNYTETTFQNDLISLSYTSDMIQVMDQAFQKMQNYTEDELHAVRNALSNVITNEAINKCKRENFSSPIDFVRAIQGFNVDNIQDVDKRIYRESKFTEIDIAKLEEEVTGNALKSSMNMINYCSPLGGYIDRTLTMVSGKPGCFTGDTKVMMIDGSWKTMQELYDEGIQNIPVYSFNEDTGDIFVTTAQKCELMKQVDKIARITLDNGYVIECTMDHLFRTVNQFYVPACELQPNMALMPIHKSIELTETQKTSRERNCTPVYESVYTITNRHSHNKFTHQLVGDFLCPDRNTRQKTVCHHIDLDKLNNSIDNIQVLTPQEHSKIHSRLNWDSQYESLKSISINNLPDNRRRDITIENIETFVANNKRASVKNISAALGCSEQAVRTRVIEKYGSMHEFRKQCGLMMLRKTCDILIPQDLLIQAGKRCDIVTIEKLYEQLGKDYTKSNIQYSIEKHFGSLRNFAREFDLHFFWTHGNAPTVREVIKSVLLNVPPTWHKSTTERRLKSCDMTKTRLRAIGKTLTKTELSKALCSTPSIIQVAQQYNISPIIIEVLLDIYNLTIEDVCTNYENHKVLSVEIIDLPTPVNVFDLINAGPYHNFAIKADFSAPHEDSGVFVHNSGKSLFLIQEACEFCKQGKKVLYLALGDMNEFHFVTRILAQQYRMSMTRVATTFRTVYTQAMNDPEMKWLDNLLIQYFTPDQISCTNWISFIKSKGYYDEYDVFIADYDSNFASEEEMYQKGETTYNQLKALSDRPGKWVFVACQPKPNYYSEEILPLESGNESSRKQQIVDNMITISFPPFKGGQNHIGVINVPKYRGGMLASTHYLMDKNGRFEEISRDLYEWLKNCLDPVTLPGSGCSDSNKEVDLSNIPLLKAK